MSLPKHVMRALIGMLVVVVSVAVADRLVAQEKDAKKKSAKDAPGKELLGHWKMTAIERNGQKMAPPIELAFVFKKGVVEQKAGGRTQEQKYKLDPKHAKHLDIIRERGGQTRVFKMIYSIDGDTMKMCSGGARMDRPTKFTSEDGYTIQLLKRVKAKKK